MFSTLWHVFPFVHFVFYNAKVLSFSMVKFTSLFFCSLCFCVSKLEIFPCPGGHKDIFYTFFQNFSTLFFSFLQMVSLALYVEIL